MRWSLLFPLATLIMAVAAVPVLAQLTPGQDPPAFKLTGLDGKSYELAKLKDRPMAVLYFFEVDSKPSQEGLISLDRLVKKYSRANMQGWGITRSAKEKVSDFASGNLIEIPILFDASDVSDRYHARAILPTVCILGPGQKVLDYLQGGGASTQAMLVRLAERNLQRKEFAVAKAISDDISKKDSGNLPAKVVKGYASLKEGDLPKAKAVFQEIAQAPGQGSIIGKEGLAEVYAREGQGDKALELVQQVEQQAPDRGYVHVIKGNILYAKDQKAAAELEYRRATQKKTASPNQKAEALNQLGRLQASAGKIKAARELYDQAVEIDPYYIEATSNKGITYEKEGRFDQALNSYRQVLALDNKDAYAAILARQAQERLSLQQDVERKKRLDSLVKELAERFRTQQKSASKSEDAWTSRPMILSFLDFSEKGGLPERDGFATVLTANLAEQLNASGRVKVVERVLVERLLEELNLGSSELADPNTALNLGKILAAKIIGTGSLLYLPAANLVNLRLIDTETSVISKVLSRQIKPGASLEKDLFELNREILKTIIKSYPLQGYVVRIVDGKAIINLGSKQGVVLGTTFDVLQEQEPVTYKGKALQAAPKAVALLKVTQVEPDLCYAQMISREIEVRQDDKVREKLEQVQ